MSTPNSFTDPLDDMYHEALDDSRYEAATNPDWSHEYHSHHAAVEDFPKQDT